MIGVTLYNLSLFNYAQFDMHTLDAIWKKNLSITQI